MKKLAFSISLLAFCCGTLPASGAQEARAVVRHGESIGKLRLGMTIPQVRRALGGPGILVKTEKRGKGYVYRELGWNLGWWTVGFMRSPGGDYTAVRIGTVSRAQRTRERLGVDSTVIQIIGKLRRSFCRDVYPLEPPDGRVLHGECIYRRPTGRQTAFVLSRYGDPDDPPGTGRVEQVEVRSLLFYRGWQVRFQFWR